MIDAPAYGFAEASRYLKLAPATLRSWFMGRNYPKRDGVGHFGPLIRLADEDNKLLSFANLIEAYVLRALRQEHGVSIEAARKALIYAERELNISKLLLSADLLTTAGHLFIKRYGELINLSQSGQLALSIMFEEHLKRIEWENKIPQRLYPYYGVDGGKVIAIDPSIGFGRPVLIRKGISTNIITDRIDSGESVEELADDYELTKKEVETAILYERAA
jgi:uncharacterized protein (DUF433 family)